MVGSRRLGATDPRRADTTRRRGSGVTCSCADTDQCLTWDAWCIAWTRSRAPTDVWQLVLPKGRRPGGSRALGPFQWLPAPGGRGYADAKRRGPHGRSLLVKGRRPTPACARVWVPNIRIGGGACPLAPSGGSRNGESRTSRRTPRRSCPRPTRLIRGDASDEGNRLSGNPGTTDVGGHRPPTPEQLEALAMPTPVRRSRRRRCPRPPHVQGRARV